MSPSNNNDMCIINECNFSLNYIELENDVLNKERENFKYFKILSNYKSNR